MTHRDKSAQSRGVAAWIACGAIQSAEVLAMASLVVQQTQYTELKPQQPAPPHQQCRPDLGKSQDLAITNNALLKWNMELYLQTILLKEDRSLGWGQGKNYMWLSLRSLQINISFCPLLGSWDGHRVDEGMIHRTLLDAEIALVLSPTC